jgi:uncharacterized HAD superfamily protein
MRQVLVDIDGVLSDDRWREGRKNVSWDEYHSACWEDPPHKDMVAMINGLHEQEYYIVALTGRPEKWRVITMNWLTKHNVAIDELLMRQENDYRRSPELKLAMAARYRDIAMVIDNRQDIVDAFKALSITTLLVSV